MTRHEIRKFLASGVNALTVSTEFGSGRLSEFNSERSHDYPSVWWNSILGDSADLNTMLTPQDKIPIELHIAQKDTMDSTAEQYEKIIDTAHRIAQRLVFAYSQILSGNKLINLTGIKRAPFVKQHADVLSGIILTFTIVVPDLTNEC